MPPTPPHQPALLRLLHGGVAALVPLAWLSGVVALANHNRRWIRLPAQVPGDRINIHGTVGMELWPIRCFASWCGTTTCRTTGSRSSHGNEAERKQFALMHQRRDGSLAWSLGGSHSGSHWRQLRQWRRPDHIGSTEHRIRRGNSHSNQAKYACTSHVARACQPGSARLEPAIPQPVQRVQPRSRFLLSAGIGTGRAEHHALQAPVVLGGSLNERAAAFARKNRTHPTS